MCVCVFQGEELDWEKEYFVNVLGREFVYTYVCEWERVSVCVRERDRKRVFKYAYVS